MRKVASILLLILLSFNLWGYQLFFYFRTCEAKAEMKAFLQKLPDHQDLDHFSFTSAEMSELKWEDDSEFFFQGKMYDVIRKSFSAGQWHIRCLPDSKESSLLKAYLNTSHKSSDSKQQALSKIITALYLLPQEKPIEVLPKTTSPLFANAGFFIRTICLPVQSPPPQLAA